MIYDFLSLERLFGEEGAALFAEDVLRKYGAQALEQAVRKGYIIARALSIGPDSGRTLCWLSQEGRALALQSPHIWDVQSEQLCVRSA